MNPVLIPIFPLIFGVLSLFLGRKMREICCILSSAISLLISVLSIASLDEGRTFLMGEVVADELGLMTALMVSLIVLLASIYSPYYMNMDERSHRSYYFLLQLFNFTMLFTCISNNIFLIWVFVEATTLSSVFLVTLKGDPTSLEAGWKYVLLCTVGLSSALLGTVMIYADAIERIGVSGIFWTELLSARGSLDQRVLEVAGVFLIAGYGVKAGLFPLHWWLPDTYSEAPTPISSVLSGVLINCSFLAIVRFHLLMPTGFPSLVLIFLGIASAVFGSIAMIGQRNVKRLLAYSSVENMGIACLGLGMGGVGALFSIFHVLNHSFLKSASFLSYGGMEKYNRSSPAAAFSLISSFILLAGCPPSGIFLSELGILSSLVERPVIAALYLISVFISFSVLSYNAMEIGLGRKLNGRTPAAIWLVPLIPVLISVVIALYPSWLLGLVERFLGGAHT